MPTRRRFLSAIASLCAAAGLSRLAGGAARAEPAPVPRIPQPGDSAPNAGMYVTAAVAVPERDASGVYSLRIQYRVMRFDKRGRLVEVSPELPEAP